MIDFLYFFLFTLTFNFPKLCLNLENPYLHFHSPLLPQYPPINVVLQPTLLTSTSLAPSLLWCLPHISSGHVLAQYLNQQPLLLGFMDEDASKVLVALASRIMVALFAWVVCPPPLSILSIGLLGYWLPITGDCGSVTAMRQMESGGCSFSYLGFFLYVCIGLDVCFKVFPLYSFFLLSVGLRPYNS
ncbi:hypothetical protein PRUPE_3G169800 [Prunus persica]|uniref:Uncharacterized protein n=1 Tax=Prunus persica TaxID=3760 RepID=A0A251Q1A7_PRUPE|nr:hypothetical protein PRUPE_3G169800 [Prunus persica]